MKKSCRWPLAGIGGGELSPPAPWRPASSTSTTPRLHHVPAAVADLLDLLGQPDGLELILNSIRSSCHQPLLAGRSASSCAAGRLCCSRMQAGVCACQPLRADAPRVLRCAAAQNPLQHAFTCLRTSLCTLLCGARRTVCSCASCVRSEAWWRVCAVLCMVSSAP